MRGVPTLLGLLLLAGCASPAADIDGEDTSALASNVFVVDDGGIRPATDVGGWTIDADGVIEIDLMRLALRDRLSLILLETLEPQKLETKHQANVFVPGIGPEGEGASGDWCMFHMFEDDVAGPMLLDRAQGLAHPEADIVQDDRRASWFLVWPPSFPTGFGWGFIMSKSSEHRAGEWLLVAFGQSGIGESDFHAPDHRASVRFEPEGAVNVYILPVTTFLCGSGFGRFQGVTAAPPMYSDGALAMTDRYGTTAAFRGSVHENLDGLLANAAELTYRDEAIRLNALSNLWRATYDPLEPEIRNERWVGDPHWLLAGLSIPHYTTAGVDVGNRTVLARGMPDTDILTIPTPG